ncbi:septal ring factor EnvC (AmiA/AmiB activator) [Paenibacillus rhizosphaerae]|uniref:Septal ring factor EnvC (AmiA/AmiB activator) n=1 Tax=Paenibacillus rhizosphaerae TaxID=297318 RepID=A0A839TZY4_9BACL|nr:hypothetical protein [Paenibacillus rhizosphaerae]MBB3130958.1 septal ring factor EnvC (AmiA/AmiB activator) [Paenibacillus rhizosphaerae]
MRRLRKTVVFMVVFLLAAVLAWPTEPVHAADSQWINQVWSDYKSYKKTVSAYQKYQEQINSAYRKLKLTSNEAAEELERTVLQDQEQWIRKLRPI